MPAVVLPFVIGNQPAQPPTQASDFDANFNALANAINTLPVNFGIPWIAAGGSADAITAVYVPSVVALTDGLTLQFRATAANATTTPTFSPNGLTPHTITKKGGLVLAAKDIPAALAECFVVYNLVNTRWELANPENPPFVSAQQSIPVAGATLTVAHGLGVAPTNNSIILHCITAELGWSIGDQLNVGPTSITQQIGGADGLMSYFDATNVYVIQGSGGAIDIFNKGSGVVGSITQANWKLIIEATA